MTKQKVKIESIEVPTQVQDEPAPVTVDPVPEVQGEQSIDDLKRMVEEMKTQNQVIMMALSQKGSSNVNLGNTGQVLGVVEKYVVDPEQYPDPCERLANEPRLQPMAFKLNYELYYKSTTSSYETKAGVNMTEPKFMISLARRVLDDQGKPVVEVDPKTGKKGEKQYGVKNMVFHEDPQAAIVTAREKGIDLDDYKDMDNIDTKQKLFLNEMRYLRIRDWLFDTFWPKPTQQNAGQKEEVIGGRIVPVFYKSSAEATGVDFDKIDGKLVV